MTKCDKCKDPAYLALLEESCEHDPETQRLQMHIAKFFQVYPKIFGLSYGGADVLRKERNKKIQMTAINAVALEIEQLKNTDSNKHSLPRRRVTADRVRTILNEVHISIEGTPLQREKLLKRKEGENAVKDKEKLQICPLCQGLIPIQSSKRDKIVSLRTTEDVDDGLAFLSKYLDVPRSLLINGLLALKIKYPELSL